MKSQKMPYDLAVVMPVYNEAECIIDVINSWIDTLSSLHMGFTILVFNDGSTDDTAQAMEIFKTHPNVNIIDKKNSGHGPTILMGYGMALDMADWIFQCDSDDEMKAEHFPDLWENRMNHDVLLGIRQNRSQSTGRKIISMVSRLTIKQLFGKGISDVNVPYRLIRRDVMQKIIPSIPKDTFAPNIILSGMISKHNYRVYEKWVPHDTRKTGEESLVQLKLWKMTLKSFLQTIVIRFNNCSGEK